MSIDKLPIIEECISILGRGCLRNRKRREQFGKLLSSRLNQREEIVQSFIDEMDGLDLYIGEDYTAFLEFCRVGL